MSGQSKSYWGVPMDTTDLQQLTAKMLIHYRDGNRPDFIIEMEKLNMISVLNFWAYLSTVAVGVRKAGDSLSAGLKMDDSDAAVLASMCQQCAPNLIIGLRAFNLMRSVCDEDYEVLGVYMARLRSGLGLSWDKDPSRDLCDLFWTLCGVVGMMISGSKVHSGYIVKAAMYRLMLCASLHLVKQHDWCEADLGTAADLAVLLDDKNMKAPGDEQVS